MSVVKEIARILEAIGSPYILTGGKAVAIRGYVRTTFDTDFLTTDARILRPETWAPLAARGAVVDARKGDVDDPLAGVVRIAFPDGQKADVVLAKWNWEAKVIERAEQINIGEAVVPVPRTADLILLKLAAGGPIDIQDVIRLLETDRDALVDEVHERIAPLPDDARDAWQRILSSQ